MSYVQPYPDIHFPYPLKPAPYPDQYWGYDQPFASYPAPADPQPPRITLAGSLDPATGIFYRTPEHPRLRTAQACEKCRTRKAKCSGDHPACSRCLARGLVCEYAKEGRVRGPNKPKTPLAAPASLPPSPHARDFPAPDKSAPRRRRNTTLAPPPPRSNAQVKPEPLSSCVPLALSGSGSGGSLKRLSLPATLDAGPYDGGEGSFGGGGGGGFNGGFEGGGYLPYPPPLQHHHAHTHHPMPALSTLALFEGAPDPYAPPYSPASYHAPGGFDSPHGSQYGGQYEHAQYDSPHGSQYEHAQYDSPHGSQYEHRGAYDSGGFDSPRAGSESESSRGSSAPQSAVSSTFPPYVHGHGFPPPPPHGYSPPPHPMQGYSPPPHPMHGYTPSPPHPGYATPPLPPHGMYEPPPPPHAHPMQGYATPPHAFDPALEHPHPHAHAHAFDPAAHAMDFEQHALVAATQAQLDTYIDSAVAAALSSSASASASPYALELAYPPTPGSLSHTHSRVGSAGSLSRPQSAGGGGQGSGRGQAGGQGGQQGGGGGALRGWQEPGPGPGPDALGVPVAF